MKNFKNIISVLLFLLPLSLVAQIRYGAIEYEIKTNLDKRFPPTTSNQKMTGKGYGKNRKNEAPQTHLVEKATLYFNDSVSIFVTTPLENMFDQNKTFTTITKTNLQTQAIATHINLLGELFFVTGTLTEKTWKFTAKERLIAGKNAKQAICTINDTTTIYAWFDTDFLPSIGPESYRGLPGAILGLAYEDGSVTYFATAIHTDFPDLSNKFPVSKSKKEYSRAEFEKEFQTKYKAGNNLFNLVKDLLNFY